MMFMDEELFSLPMLACFDNDEIDDVIDDVIDEPDDTTPPAKPAAKPVDPKVLTFTQDELNKKMAENKRSLQKQLKTLESNYAKLLENQSLTDATRQALEEDLENVRKSQRTEKQQMEIESKRAAEKHQNELKQTQEKADKYEKLFRESTVERAITDAAAKHEAYNPSQFISLLSPKTKLVEEVDAANQRTGRLVPMVEVYVKNENTDTYEPALKTPEQAIEDMKGNLSEYGNMFRPNVVRGIGEGTSPTSNGTPGRVDARRLDPKDYMEMRKTAAGRRALGLE